MARPAVPGSATAPVGPSLPAEMQTTMPLLTAVLTLARSVGSVPPLLRPKLMLSTLMLWATRWATISSRAALISVLLAPAPLLGKTLAPAQRQAGARPRNKL